MERSEDDDEKHDFEEGPQHVAARCGQQRYGEYRRHGALHDGKADHREGVAHALHLVHARRRDEGDGDVRRIVDAEADAHDDVCHRDAVHVDPPPRHVADDARADGRDAECDGQTTRQRRYQDQRHDHHGGHRQSEVAQRRWHDDGVLVEENEQRMERRYDEVSFLHLRGDLSRQLHHRCLAD